MSFFRFRVKKGFFNRRNVNGYFLACDLLSSEKKEIIFHNNLILKNGNEYVGKVIGIEHHPEYSKEYIIDVIIYESYKKDFIGVELIMCKDGKVM